MCLPSVSISAFLHEGWELKYRQVYFCRTSEGSGWEELSVWKAVSASCLLSVPSAVSSGVFPVQINYTFTENAFILGYCFSGESYKNTLTLLMMLIRVVIKCLTFKLFCQRCASLQGILSHQTCLGFCYFFFFPAMSSYCFSVAVSSASRIQSGCESYF